MADSLLIGNVRSRLWRQNKNWIFLIQGETGSGKSYCGLTLCEQIDKTFDIDKVCFSALEVIRLINSGKIKRGSAILLDEGGVGMAARKFMSNENVSFGYLLQSFRLLNCALIVTVPQLDFVDLQMRTLLHAIGQTQAIDRKKKLCRLKVLTLQYNSFTKTLYRKYLRFRDKNGKICKLQHIWVSMPSDKLRKEYEAKKRAFTKELNARIEATLSKEGQEKKEKPAATTRSKIEVELTKGELSDAEIVQKLRTHPRYLREVKALLPRKKEEER